MIGAVMLLRFEGWLLPRHGDFEALFRRDQVIEIHRSLPMSISTQFTSPVNSLFLAS